MSEPVLTDEEKNALLEGVSSGAVQVCAAAGPHYATVKPWVIGTRSRIESNSYPRLVRLNEQLATDLAARLESLLQANVNVTRGSLRRMVHDEYCDGAPADVIGISFRAPPLPGDALLVVETQLVGPLIEAFFGGEGDPAGSGADIVLSPGALAVLHVVGDEFLRALKSVWSPLRELAPERVATRVGLEPPESPTGDVIVCDFDLALGEGGESRGAFSVAWPQVMLSPLLPALEGRRQVRDSAEDSRWERALRARIADVIVALDSNVGHAQITLGDLINLAPGDVFGIESPRVATVLAQGVPLLEGRFGVQSGRNAIEAVGWLPLAAG